MALDEFRALDITASALLDLWEGARLQPLTARALMLLALLYPQETPAALAAMPVSRRDACLIWLRSRLFGDTLSCAVNCPTCTSLLEFDLRASILLDGRTNHVAHALYEWEDGNYVLRFRLPASADVQAALNSPPAKQHANLLRSLIVETQVDGRLVDDLPPSEILDAFGRHMLNLDPLADIRLELDCATCGQQWQSPFDIVSYLWQELDRWAGRTLRQVHSLALAYGWSEADILAMSAWRRARYLEMIHG